MYVVLKCPFFLSFLMCKRENTFIENVLQNYPSYYDQFLKNWPFFSKCCKIITNWPKLMIVAQFVMQGLRITQNATFWKSNHFRGFYKHFPVGRFFWVTLYYVTYFVTHSVTCFVTHVVTHYAVTHSVTNLILLELEAIQTGTASVSDWYRKCIRLELEVHQTKTGSASDLNRKCIGPTKVVHQTGTGSASERNQKCIRPQPDVHLSGTGSASWRYKQQWVSTTHSRLVHIPRNVLVSPCLTRSKTSIAMHVHMHIPDCDKCIKFPTIIEEDWVEKPQKPNVIIENNIAYEFKHYIRA